MALKSGRGGKRGRGGGGGERAGAKERKVETTARKPSSSVRRGRGFVVDQIEEPMLVYVDMSGIVSNTLRPPIPETCDPEWRSLMEQCWAAEPAERPNFSDIANRSNEEPVVDKGEGGENGGLLLKEKSGRVGDGRIVSAELHKEATEAYVAYAMSVLLGRALSDVRDVSWFQRPNIMLWENNTIVGCIDCKLENVPEIGSAIPYQKAMELAFQHIIASEHKPLVVYRTHTPNHFENGTWNTGGYCNMTLPFIEGEVEGYDQDQLVKVVEGYLQRAV
ncbi:uncharacterized protein A4U43_C03F30480 [Asparagus officinalis]|uniref:Uncharacterized protein n=1 Tax=Asparagus officinalis TaxID=4686 RepID=A0A5P1FF16_ASPOF|nr:uncharacterized protein A4U43_C03F30480 [Asparagus officinalis]